MARVWDTAPVPSKEERAGQGTFLAPQRDGPLLLLLHSLSASPLSPAQRESRHQEFSGTFKNCEERNSREDSEREKGKGLWQEADRTKAGVMKRETHFFF